MPQSLSFMLEHLVFSTKDRAGVLTKSIQSELHPYMATLVRDLKCEAFLVGGAEDHVHLAIGLSRTISMADLVEGVKVESSKWLKTKGIPYFAWQRGYGVFSVGPRDLDALLRYIRNQEEHHRRQSFQDEYRSFLNRYGMKFDERYVWD
jgi:putative transposase